MRSDACGALIVGQVTDPHVRRVTDLLPERGTVVIDAETIPTNLVSWGLKDATFIDLSGAETVVDSGTNTRGWIRRLAPAGWDDGAIIGTQQTASLLARLGTIGSITRDSQVKWLSLVDQIVSTENKMMQYRAAIKLGISVPEAVIARHADTIRSAIGDDFVVKPIGPGNFTDSEGRPSVAFARSIKSDELEQVDLLYSPFIFQERVTADAHFRVVTVENEAWVARLDAKGLPVDWRSSEAAHSAFVIAEEADLMTLALALSNALALGYSSQDWIQSKGINYFVDLNPGGQWMFLPTRISDQVAASLADFLCGDAT